MKPVVETHSGQFVNLLEPDPATINIQDIAWSLSRTARFNGHTKGEHTYTVAQHSAFVAYHASTLFYLEKDLLLHALLHDAHEAYMGDIVSPLKYLSELKSLKVIEQGLQAAICTALDLPVITAHQKTAIAHCDILALAREANHLLVSKGKGDGWNLPEFPEHLLNQPLSALSHQSAYEQFWMSYQFIKKGLPLDSIHLPEARHANENKQEVWTIENN